MEPTDHDLLIKIKEKLDNHIEHFGWRLTSIEKWQRWIIGLIVVASLANWFKR